MSFDRVIEGIRKLEAERTRYKDEVEAIKKIITKPFGPGDKGGQASDRILDIKELLGVETV